MSRQIQLRRGTSAEHENFTGVIGEVTVDTTNNTLRVHDGQTLGGTTLAKQSEIPDLTPYDYVVAWQMPTAENNNTWYRKYKSGWVEQGGPLTGRAVTFPIPFAIVPTLSFSTKTSVDTAVYQNSYSSLSVTGFAGWRMGVNSNWLGPVSDWAGYWTAFGICAE